jgi:magnesium-transporting ATPase (P-type)
MMDRDVPVKYVMDNVYLAYSTGRDREMLNLRNMGRWVLLAFGEGLVLYAMAIRFIGGKTTSPTETGASIHGIGLNDRDGEGGGIYADGLLLFCCIIVAMQFKVAAITCVWTWMHIAFWLLSVTGFILFIFAYSQFIDIPEWYQVPKFVFYNSVFWLALLIIPITISIMDYTIETIASMIFPSSQDKLMIKVHEQQQAELLSTSREEEELARVSDSKVSLRV